MHDGRVGWCVYILRCGDGTLYTGATNDLAARLARHAAGRGARYTRGRGPLEVALVLPARGRGAALRREAAVKRMGRREKMELIAGTVGKPWSPRPRPRADAP
ncbi:MAG TPA: GIY-YIG nuclease family protein [Anaeromyxobacteraceae bacterium]|nr:GIY-YIG nuclease family protein [Anaeromyxobacteraceae bacterium]